MIQYGGKLNMEDLFQYKRIQDINTGEISTIESQATNEASEGWRLIAVATVGDIRYGTLERKVVQVPIVAKRKKKDEQSTNTSS